MLAAGAAPDGATDDGATPLFIAALQARPDCEHEEVVGKLITAGAKVDATAGDGATPLLAACRSAHAGVVDRLLRGGRARAPRGRPTA